MHREVVSLLASGRIEQVAVMPELIKLYLNDSLAHLKSAISVSKSEDINGAYQLAYDSARKSCAALIAHHGFRATSRGGHHALFLCARHFSPLIGSIFDDLETFRKRRNFVEYPESVGQLVTPERLEFSLLLAGDVLKIVSQTVA